MNPSLRSADPTIWLRSVLGVPVLCCAGLAACGGGGGGGEDGTRIAGMVRSPDGQGIGLTGRTRPPVARAEAEEGGRERIDLPGLLPVPDGTNVELVRLDAVGAATEVLASTTTSAGLYTFDLSSLGLTLAADLEVEAGSGATRLRAPAARTALDVDPLSEVLVRLVESTGSAPLDFTVGELADLGGALELLARLADFTAQADLAATLADWLQGAQADPAFDAFLLAAAEPGQTAQGPGDMGDYFAADVGNAWGLAGELVEDGGPGTAYTRARRILSVDGGGVLTVRVRESLEPAANEELLLETPTGVLYLGNGDPGDPLNTVTPFELVRFPLAPGEIWEQFDVSGVSLGFDLDGDQHDEVVDVRAERTLVGFEDVSVPAGTFTDCARFDTTQLTTLHFTSGPPVRATLARSDWFAPGVGPLRSASDLVLTGASIQAREERSEELTSYQAGGQGHGILPAEILASNLSAASSDPETPGRLGLGFDGARFLAVTCREGVGMADLTGIFLARTGLTEAETALFDLGSSCGGPRPAVTFDGTNHLVVFQDEGQIVGLRVSPAGVVLDPGGFPISSTGTSNFQPAVAFDGTNALVVWRKFDNFLLGDLYGARVTPGGSVLGEFPILAQAGEQRDPALAVGAGSTLVVFTDASQATPEVRAVRVAPDETVLDPTGFDLAVNALAEDEPAVSFDGTNHLVVWVRQSPNFAHDVLATRVAPDGTVLDGPPIAIAATGASHAHPSVAFDGTNSLVSWQVESSAGASIRAARLTPAGVLLDGAPAAGGVLVELPPSAARLVYPVLARGTSNLLLAWIVNRELLGQAKDLAGTLVYPF
jgi:hypothetical protein